MLISTLALSFALAQSFTVVQQPPAALQTPQWQRVPSAPPNTDVWTVAPSYPRALQSARQGAWLGISLLDSKDGGPNVGQVVGGSPAEQAGFKPGDRIVALDGQAVASTDAVIEFVGRAHPGAKVTAQVRRDVTVALDDEHKSSKGAFVLGVQLGSQQKVGDDDAVEIASMLDGWPAQNAGIQAGDALISVEGKRVASSEHVTNVLKSIKEAREVHVEIARNIEVTLGAQKQDLAPNLAQPRQNGLGSPLLAVPAQPKRATPPRAVPSPAAPHARAPQTKSDEAMLEEVRALSRELRELRDQISALRGQLEQLQSHR